MASATFREILIYAAAGGHDEHRHYGRCTTTLQNSATCGESSSADVFPVCSEESAGFDEGSTERTTPSASLVCSQDDMLALLDEGSRDEDSWVKVVADVMSTLPEKGLLNHGQAGEVRTLAEKCASG